MLFSQPKLAGYLNDNFECAWQSLRPVPHVEIDFGNGTKLERTLSGNIATWFCAADGRVLDVLPGLVGPTEYRRRADEALTLVERLWPFRGTGMQESRWNLDPLGVRAEVALFHELRRSIYLIAEPALADGEVLDVSKFRVENRIKESVQVVHKRRLLRVRLIPMRSWASALRHPEKRFKPPTRPACMNTIQTRWLTWVRSCKRSLIVRR